MRNIAARRTIRLLKRIGPRDNGPIREGRLRLKPSDDCHERDAVNRLEMRRVRRIFRDVRDAAGFVPGKAGYPPRVVADTHTEHNLMAGIGCPGHQLLERSHALTFVKALLLPSPRAIKREPLMRVVEEHACAGARCDNGLRTCSQAAVARGAGFRHDGTTASAKRAALGSNDGLMSEAGITLIYCS